MRLFRACSVAVDSNVTSGYVFFRFFVIGAELEIYYGHYFVYFWIAIHSDSSFVERCNTEEDVEDESRPSLDHTQCVDGVR